MALPISTVGGITSLLLAGCAVVLIGLLLVSISIGSIAYSENGGGMARQNECWGNGMYGIYVAETANPELIDNNCHDNVEADVRDERR